MKKIHAFSNDALGTDDAVGLVDKLKKKEVSPLELAEAAIARAKKVNTELNAVQEEAYSKAITNINELPNGYFSGIPTFIKDNLDIVGFKTHHGSQALTSAAANKNDPYAKHLLAQGFNVLGKSTLPEMGLNASTEFSQRPPTCNPWDTAYSCGASSGGSAALVTSGVVPLAHANDGGGSIRIPAACSGLVGLKPSRGRHVKTHLSQSLPVDIISQGIVSRSVRDTAYFHAQMENQYKNPKLPEIGLVTCANTKRLRIGMIIDSITGSATDQETRAATEKTAQTLIDAGHDVIEISTPFKNSFASDFKFYWAVLAFFTQKFGHKILDPNFDKDKLEPLTNGLSNFGKKRILSLPLVLYRLKKSYYDYAKAIKDYDAILTPTLCHTTPELGFLNPSVPFDELFQRLTDFAGFTPLANATGCPAISLPVAMSSNDLPIGVQFFGPHGGERTLLEIAYELEQAMPFAEIFAN